MPYCDRCDRSFRSSHALEAHRRDSNQHHVCYQCDKDYRTYHSLRQHLSHSSMHNFCTWCDEDFDDIDDLGDHNNEEHSFCEPCELWLETPSEMLEHDKEIHNYCVECERYFGSPNALRNHLNSSKHLPKNITCPGHSCGAQFISNGALFLHLEAGVCRSGATRQALNRLIAARDTQHIITNPSRMIAGTTQTWATERAWNEDTGNYECYFCHKEYETLARLNQHLASPAHERPIYHCPKLGHGCQAKFKTMSGLCQHVENGSCGVMRFNLIQQTMNNFIGGMRRITF
ncbi:Zinc finger protein [Ceratobasidium theobromae]|uniref:Zinc finger protein n=1 Tax=Ceratobasidium theobromae TaxID=1582974 RepID=A0A5N5QUG7_9AGAM|nr:Zinc finger protein [Ceratobasidium theobromae]